MRITIYIFLSLKLMLFITRYTNTVLKNYLKNSPTKKIVWINEGLLKKTYIGSSNVSLASCNHVTCDDFIDYNYLLSIPLLPPCGKLSSNHELMHFTFDINKTDKKHDRVHQLNIFNNIVFNNYLHSEINLINNKITKPHYTFIYNYNNVNELQIYSNNTYNNFFENNIVCIDSDKNPKNGRVISLRKFTENESNEYNKLGLLVLKIEKL